VFKLSLDLAVNRFWKCPLFEGWVKSCLELHSMKEVINHNLNFYQLSEYRKIYFILQIDSQNHTMIMFLPKETKTENLMN
jgi:hypothetical protein